jgi:hypothetical protein
VVSKKKNDVSAVYVWYWGLGPEKSRRTKAKDKGIKTKEAGRGG